MSLKKKRKKVKKTVIKPEKTRHYFFLNPYEDCAFTKCPKCDQATKVRKFPLAIHIDPQQLLFLNKSCRYCEKCDLIIVKKPEVESLMAASFENVNPSIIGNEYLVFGTLDRSDWQRYKEAPTDSKEAFKQVYVFKDVLKFEVMPRGWYLPGKK